MLALFTSFSLSNIGFELLRIELTIIVGIGLSPLSHDCGSESSCELLIGSHAGNQVMVCSNLCFSRTSLHFSPEPSEQCLDAIHELRRERRGCLSHLTYFIFN